MACMEQLKMPSERIPEYLEQEEKVCEEVKDVIWSLPKTKGWVANHLYLYLGFWYPVRHLNGLLSALPHFTSLPNDVVLVSTPKSGTTWLKAIIFSLLNRTRYPPNKNHPLFNSNPHDLLPFLELIKTHHPISDPSSPRLFSTHLPYISLPESVKHNSSCKIVYLCRNPKDIFVSLWHFANKLKPPENERISINEAFDMFCRGVSLFGPCWDHVLGYWDRSVQDSGRVLFVKFEEVKEKPGAQLRRLADFLGCPFSAAEEDAAVAEEILRLCSFESLSGMQVNRSGKLSSGEDNGAFFRRGEVGDWRNYLDGEMAEKLDRITEEKFKGSGLVL